MNVTPNKLKKILDTFGHRCLLILDGFDELSSRSQPEIVKIIKGQKLLSCNIFLTSRPHILSEFENLFEIVARLQGFTREHADAFISKFFNDKKKRREVRKFTTKHKFFHDSLHTSPIFWFLSVFWPKIMSLTLLEEVGKLVISILNWRDSYSGNTVLGKVMHKTF